MTRNVRISFTLIVVLAAAVFGYALLNDSSEPPASAAQTGTTADTNATAAAPVIRPETHRLSRAPADAPELVEFLDFECEACGALYPYMEQLRAEYDGRVTFAIRYFPLPGHANGMNAALAVEAAARQGALEPMYRTMYETQRSWGEARESHAETFVGFARRLGLDVPRFKRDVAAPATEARVKLDQDDGVALGVEATPTLFLDGVELVPESLEQLRAALDAALEG